MGELELYPAPRDGTRTRDHAPQNVLIFAQKHAYA